MNAWQAVFIEDAFDFLVGTNWTAGSIPSAPFFGISKDDILARLPFAHL